MREPVNRRVELWATAVFANFDTDGQCLHDVVVVVVVRLQGVEHLNKENVVVAAYVREFVHDRGDEHLPQVDGCSFTDILHLLLIFNQWLPVNRHLRWVNGLQRRHLRAPLQYGLAKLVDFVLDFLEELRLDWRHGIVHHRRDSTAVDSV